MVAKKASADNVKQSVTKTSARKSVKTSTTAKPAVSKTEVKKTTVAKKIAVTPSVAKKEVIPVKANHDVVSEVMAIKDRNEAKKSLKTAKKKADVPVMEKVTEEKGRKASPENSRREAIKENVRIAGTKKFLELKERSEADSIAPEEAETELNGGTFHAWARTYRNIFNFKGRTSRFEMWSFQLINLFFIAFIELAALFIPVSLSPALFWPFLIGTVVFYLAEALIYLSVSVRRLHDAGYTAWNGFFRPFTGWWLLTFAISITNWRIYAPYMEESELSTPIPTTTLWVGSIALLIAVLLSGYYSIKIFIVSHFFEEIRGANEYGSALFYDNTHKRKALRYATVYLLLAFINYMVYVISAIARLYMGGMYY